MIDTVQFPAQTFQRMVNGKLVTVKVRHEPQQQAVRKPNRDRALAYRAQAGATGLYALTPRQARRVAHKADPS